MKDAIEQAEEAKILSRKKKKMEAGIVPQMGKVAGLRQTLNGVKDLGWIKEFQAQKEPLCQ